MKQGAYNIKPGTETYYMWYAGSGPTGRHIGLATADNPLGPWKKYEGNPIVKDFGYLGGVEKVNGKFLMFVQHPVDEHSDQGPFKVAFADRPEGPWTKFKGNPVLTPGDWDAWDDGGFSEAGIRYHEGVYHTVYGGTKNPKLESLGYAYSLDGFNWTKYPANPVVPLTRVPDGSGFAESHLLVEGSYIYVFHTMRYFTGKGTARGLKNVPDWETEDLAVQVLTIDPHFKITYQVLAMDSLGPRESSRVQASLPIGLEAASTLAIATEATYDSNAKAGVRLHVRGCDDGVNCDTADLHTFDIDLQPGKTVRKTLELKPSVKYAKVVVENLDRSRPVKSVKVTATVGN